MMAIQINYIAAMCTSSVEKVLVTDGVKGQLTHCQVVVAGNFQTLDVISSTGSEDADPFSACSLREEGQCLASSLSSAALWYLVL